MPLCNIFLPPSIDVRLTFELFDNPEKIACCDDNYIEYNENGIEKNKNADIILFEETNTYNVDDNDSEIVEDENGSITIHVKMNPIKDVKELFYKTSKYHNVIITNPIFDGTNLNGFIHPTRQQQFIKTTKKPIISSADL